MNMNKNKLAEGIPMKLHMRHPTVNCLLPAAYCLFLTGW